MLGEWVALDLAQRHVRANVEIDAERRSGRRSADQTLSLLRVAVELATRAAAGQARNARPAQAACVDGA
jgi:hypothetical protein